MFVWRLRWKPLQPRICLQPPTLKFSQIPFQILLLIFFLSLSLSLSFYLSFSSPSILFVTPQELRLTIGSSSSRWQQIQKIQENPLLFLSRLRRRRREVNAQKARKERHDFPRLPFFQWLAAYHDRINQPASKSTTSMLRSPRKNTSSNSIFIMCKWALSILTSNLSNICLKSSRPITQ